MNLKWWSSSTQYGYSQITQSELAIRQRVDCTTACLLLASVPSSHSETMKGCRNWVLVEKSNLSSLGDVGEEAWLRCPVELPG